MSYSTDQIGSATNAPQANVNTHWNNILNALDDFGIDTDMVQIAAAATIAVETGSFTPIIEKHASQQKQPSIWALQERYWHTNFMGRGFIQLTFQENYKKYGDLIGVDLVSNPDLALESVNASRVLAAYFKDRKVNEAADARDWKRVRRLVNGGLIGYDKFMQVVKQLGGTDGLV